LHGVEQDVVELLEHRQYRLARDRGPASEYRGDLLLGDELARFLREQRPIRGRVDDDRFEFLAEQAALLVLLLDQHEHDVLQRCLADCHRAGERVENADFNGVLSLGGKRGGQAKCQPRRGHKQAAGKRSLDDRSDGCMHRDVLLFDARQAAQSRLRALNRKQRAKRQRQDNPLRHRPDRASTGLIRSAKFTQLPPK
jgi:hypothetical protein